MPANLPPQYFEVERRYREAKSEAEKLQALEEMLRTIPKHKGTEKLQAEIKQKISRMRKSLQKEKSRKGSTFNPFYIEKAGATQIAIIGPPNSGKSTLLATLTNASPQIADYPFTTYRPLPGMMEYENIQIQLIDFPPIAEKELEGNFASALQRVRACLLVVDAKSATLLEEIENIRNKLEKYRISLNKEIPEWHTLRTLLLCNKVERPEDQEIFSLVEELWKEEFPVWAISLKNIDEKGKAELKKRIFEIAGIIRVYSKPPNRPPDMSRPFVLFKGQTVMDLAELIHKEVASSTRGARVWGSVKFEGQFVPVDYQLEDGDVVEIHTH
ncbi:50S ribosome-binding GTPase [Thermatribacter velox]|uniref:50S ribosome-binding GTPase n=1 Tax=Thermatribacter velox TaxID=3039681 RepID=A0ABZ2YCU9_9BACT